MSEKKRPIDRILEFTREQVLAHKGPLLATMDLALPSAEPAFYVRIPVTPVAQGRPRLTTRGGKPRAYDPPKSRAWKKVAAQWMALDVGHTFTGPVEMTVEFVFPRPERLKRAQKNAALATREYRVERPDIENLVKATMDAAQTAGVFHDDAQVVRLVAVKLHAAQGEAPAVMVSVKALDSA